jgi:type I restriction enzyme, S subunit
MKQGREIKKLGDVCYSKSSNVSQNKLVDEIGDYPIFGASGLIKNVSFYHRDKPYLSIVKDGSGFGRITKMDAFTSVIGTLQYILPNDEIDLDYLNYSLMSVDFKKYVQGAAIPHIYFKDYKNEPFLWMPFPEQQRIVAILDDAFAKMEKAKANAEQNLKNAKELFESYLQGVFENKGDGWQEVRFENLCKLTRGHNPPKSKFISEPKEGYIRFYQIRDGWADNYAVYVPITPQLHRVEPDEILMVAYRHIGKVFRGVSGAFNVALCKISNKDKNKLDDDYLFYVIPTDIVKGELMKRSERSLIPSMSIEHLKEILIPLPPLKEQKIIVQNLNNLSAETKKLEAIYQKKIYDLEELKKSVLQKAFAGELCRTIVGS